MDVEIKCRMVAVKKTAKGSYRCCFVTDKQDVITSYIKDLNEDMITSLAKAGERKFGIPDDTILFFRGDAGSEDKIKMQGGE